MLDCKCSFLFVCFCTYITAFKLYTVYIAVYIYSIYYSLYVGIYSFLSATKTDRKFLSNMRQSLQILTFIKCSFVFCI